MKLISIEFEGKRPTIEMQVVKKGFFKTTIETRKYQAIRERIRGESWEWLEMPNMSIVTDLLSLQLNAWYRNYTTQK